MHDELDRLDRTDNAGGTPIASGTVASPFMHQGRRYDPEALLYYNRARYYRPETGRFTTRDPIGVWGDSTNVGNAYTFTGNNPATSIDVSGLQAAPQRPCDEFGTIRRGPGQDDCRQCQLCVQCNHLGDMQGDTIELRELPAEKRGIAHHCLVTMQLETGRWLYWEVNPETWKQSRNDPDPVRTGPWKFGFMRARNGMLRGSGRENNHAFRRHSLQIDIGENVCDYQQALDMWVTFINNADIDYDALGPGPNSNTFVKAIIESLGYVPAPKPDGWAPGWNNTSLDFVANPNDR